MHVDNVALAVFPVPPLVEVTVTWLRPPVVAVTSTENVQKLLVGIVPPERLITPEAATAVTVPPQGLTAGVTLGVAATLIPPGRLSVKATPVSATVFAFGFVMVNVKVELPPCVVFVGLNALAITGGATTVRVAVLLTVPGLGVCVVLTPEVAFGLSPTLLLVTAKVTVQLVLAGIVIPLKLKAVAPATNVLGVVPTHVPPTAPPAALMFVSVSVKLAPVSAVPFELTNVRVTVELPPTDGIEVGLKALVIVGGFTMLTTCALLVDGS